MEVIVIKWFKHDSSASVDAKVEKLIMRYGLEGYGLYFYCLEMIARTVEKHNLTFELEHDAELIAHRVGLSQTVVENMMTYMVELGLFENDRGVITCLKMATRTDEYTQKLLKTTKINMLSRQSPDSLPIKSELKEEKRREEKRIDNRTKRKRFTPPAIKELIEHINNPEEAEKFILYYESNGWKVGKNKMANWKSAFTNWVKRSKDYNSPQSSDPYKPWANGMEL